jgi:hypothetical protein
MSIYAKDENLRKLHGANGHAYVALRHDARRYSAEIERHVLAACDPVEAVA